MAATDASNIQIDIPENNKSSAPIKIIALISILSCLGFHAIGWTSIYFDDLYETPECTFSIRSKVVCSRSDSQQYIDYQCVGISASDCLDLRLYNIYLTSILLTQVALLILLFLAQQTCCCICGCCPKYIIHIIILLIQIFGIVASCYIFYKLENIKINTTAGVPITINSLLRWKCLGMGVLILLTLPMFTCLDRILQEWRKNTPRREPDLNSEPGCLGQICLAIIKFVQVICYVWAVASVPCYLAYEILSWICYFKDIQNLATQHHICQSDYPDEFCGQLVNISEIYRYILLSSSAPLILGFLGWIIQCLNLIIKDIEAIFLLLILVSFGYSIAAPIILFINANKLRHITTKWGTSITIDEQIPQIITASGALLLCSLPFVAALFYVLAKYYIKRHDMINS